jgi:hypothetical protein
VGAAGITTVTVVAGRVGHRCCHHWHRQHAVIRIVLRLPSYIPTRCLYLSACNWVVFFRWFVTPTAPAILGFLMDLSHLCFGGRFLVLSGGVSSISGYYMTIAGAGASVML